MHDVQKSSNNICVAAVHKVAYVGTLNKEDIAF